MKLSELKTGEKGVIVKVTGHGGFRKRIVEMGFIKGKVVEVLLNAPLKDPVKYKIMNYEVSLRHNEADMIEVLSMDEAAKIERENATPQGTLVASADDDEQPLSNQQLHDAAIKKRRTINVALVGNPNCGKTSLFNFASGAHERVGNYSGVTVDAKEGHADFEGYHFNIVDLPGTYSLSAYSPEELYVRKQLVEKTPDVVINVIDTSNLERNLYLTTELIDMHLRMVCALNMFDETEKRGDNVDYNKLGQLFGVPMVPTVFKSGKGVEMLFHIIINVYEGVDYLDDKGNLNPEVAKDIAQWHNQFAGSTEKAHPEDFASGDRPKDNVYRHIHINHGKYVEDGITAVQNAIKQQETLRERYSTRYLAIKMLENDKDVQRIIDTLPGAAAINSARDAAAAQIKDETQQDSETAIMDAKYGFIHGALQEAEYATGNKHDTYQTTHIIDRIITNRFVGFPIFFIILFVMFEATFVIGQYPMDWIDNAVSWLAQTVGSLLPPGPVRDLIADGIIAGVGAVIVFMPQILILYFFIALMEDSGYMARAAFIMDKMMHKMGLHGKSFIPLIMGFGCNVPAVMSTRTIESHRSRLITMLILPFMSCSARWPIYIMITCTFFAVKYQSLVILSLYAVGIVMAVVAGGIFSRFVFKGEDTPFVMELPPYRFPTAKALARHTWERGKQYLHKMGTTILLASIIVWALGYFPHNDSLTHAEQLEQSYIGRIGKTVEPVFKAQGFDWKLDVGLIAGVGAKEIVASTIGVIYTDNDDITAADNDDVTDNSSAEKYTRLHQRMVADGLTPLAAYCFLLFVLLYFPCIATIAAIKSETGTWRWALFAAAYTTLLAWTVSAVVYQVGSLLT